MIVKRFIDKEDFVVGLLDLLLLLNCRLCQLNCQQVAWKRLLTGLEAGIEAGRPRLNRLTLLEVYLLVDIGLKVSHSVKRECLALQSAD